MATKLKRPDGNITTVGYPTDHIVVQRVLDKGWEIVDSDDEASKKAQEEAQNRLSDNERSFVEQGGTSPEIDESKVNNSDREIEDNWVIEKMIESNNQDHRTEKALRQFYNTTDPREAAIKEAEETWVEDRGFSSLEEAAQKMMEVQKKLDLSKDEVFNRLGGNSKEQMNRFTILEGSDPVQAGKNAIGQVGNKGTISLYKKGDKVVAAEFGDKIIGGILKDSGFELQTNLMHPSRTNDHQGFKQTLKNIGIPESTSGSQDQRDPVEITQQEFNKHVQDFQNNLGMSEQEAIQEAKELFSDRPGINNVTSGGGQAGSGQTTLRPGLSDQQIQSIRNLISSGRQFSETDAKNFAFATQQGNPEQFVGMSGNEALQSIGVDVSQSGGTGTGSGQSGAGDSGQGKTASDVLEKFLEARQKAQENQQKQQQEQNEKRQERTQEALSFIDNTDLQPGIKKLWKSVVENYPSGVEVNPDEILNTFDKIKEETIDPKFRSLTEMAKRDFEKAVEFTQKARDIEKEREEEATEEAIESERERLEKSGLTFSGEAKERLGSESSFKEGGEEPLGEDNVPEGEVPQERRLIASSSRLKNKQDLFTLGQKAEGKIGSETTEDLGIPEFDVLGGVTGEIEEAKQSREASTLSSLITQKGQKSKSNQNINFS